MRSIIVEARITFICLIIGLSLTIQSAFAALVDQDLNAPNDHLATLDTNTGFLWLDLSETSGISYGSIISGAGGWVSNGWRHATLSEVVSLFGTYAYIDSSCPDCSQVQMRGYEIRSLVEHLGQTSPRSNAYFATGIFDDLDESDPDVGFANYQYLVPTDSSYISIHTNFGTPNVANSAVGHFLVQATPVPIPSTIYLMLSGVLILLRHKSRSRHKA